MTASSRIPATIISGFLGAGKTTLLNHLIQHAEGRRLAVLVNDFGQINVDASTVAEVADGVYSLSNGCICCNMQGELINQLTSIAALEPRVEHLLIECSGAARPYRLVATLGYPKVKEWLRLESVVTVVNPQQLADLDARYVDLARAQLGAADLVVVRQDAVPETGLEAFKAAWLRPDQHLVCADHGKVPPALVLDAERDLLTLDPASAEHGAEHGLGAWSIDVPARLDYAQFKRFIAALPASVVRLKGYVRFADNPEQDFLVNWVHGRADYRAAAQSHAAEPALVVIGWAADISQTELEVRLKACQAA